MLVTEIGPGSDLTKVKVTRGFGTTPAAASNVGDGLYIIGNVSEENAGARNVNNTQTTRMSNYTQIFKTTMAVSGTEDAAKLYGGRD